LAHPPAALVGLLANDDPAIARPVIANAALDTQDWVDMLAAMRPTSRALLRLRRDLPEEVERALASFGAVDFALPPADTVPSADEPAGEPATPSPANEPVPAEPSAGVQRGPFRIADLVARIDAYRRKRDENGPLLPWPPETVFGDASRAARAGPGAAFAFRFETDAGGVVRWVDGVNRAALIGLALDLTPVPAGARVDGVAAGAFRRRAPFADARLLVDGLSDAAGAWRISAVPVFDRASGRFMGYRGTGRRPRADEAAEPMAAAPVATSDSLRQLVHELRTPTTAIAGFAEMIESEMLGPVPPAYRGYAGAIRGQTAGLLGAIDDLDTAARIESGALDLRPEEVAFLPLVARLLIDLQPLADLRRAKLSIDPAAGEARLIGDPRAIERLLGRLLAAVVSVAQAGEAIRVGAVDAGEAMLAITINRPRALTEGGDVLVTVDGDDALDLPGAPLLGVGFALRLTRNLAAELGGALTIGVDRLTLRLPAAFIPTMGQASNN